MEEEIKIGTMVHYKESEKEIDGVKYSTVSAAVVTAVHSNDCVNLTLLRDGGFAKPVTSITRGTQVGSFQEIK
jgi:hypothetical protein